MRLLVDKATFLSELSCLRTLFADKEGSNLHRSTILIETDDHAVAVKASDGNAMAIGKVAAKVVEDGTVYIEGPSLLNLLKLLPDGELTLHKMANGWLSVSIGEFSANLPAGKSITSLDGYGEPTTEISLPLADFNRMIGETSFILARGGDIPLAKTALLEIQPGAARLVSTDGYRMAMSSVGELSDGPSKLVLTKRSILQLKAVLADQRGEVKIGYSDTIVRFQAGDRRIVTKLAAGAYPAYQRIIPKDAGVVATVSADALRQAIKRVTLLAAEHESARVVLQMTSSSELRVEAKDTVEGDAAREDIEAAITADKLPIRVKFMARYVLDALGAIDDDRVRIKMKQGMMVPVAFVSDSDPDAGLQIVMPLELREPLEESNDQAA